MNRNKKPFTPNMRVAALYLLMGVLLLLAVTLFSGRESMRATEEYFDRTINFVKVQSTSYEKYNDTITAKSLRRMAVSVRQLAENDALDIYDPEALRKETESLWLTGIAVLDENGESLCEYTDGNIDYAQFAESLREQAALNVLQNPQKTYLKRILLQDGTAVDVATRRAAAGVTKWQSFILKILKKSVFNAFFDHFALWNNSAFYLHTSFDRLLVKFHSNLNNALSIYTLSQH